MLRLSRLADYAVVLLHQIACKSTLCSSRELAEQTGLPRPTVIKILKDLNGHGLLISVRGVNGGYRLARPADEMSILSVIEAMDGPMSLTACAQEIGPVCCDHEGHCQIREPWRRINEVISGALDNLRLADMGSLNRVEARLNPQSEQRL
ncbi:MAG: SUF system Fe-S cluster assembly regulator [Myxococcota bacterium]|jgi:FeS assembly SUF system regulator|nr:SUF system Fe-S cluster assembly regulator [Myxococcota bacterium]